ncbi:hypothetical protein [Streptomyces sp. 8N616]|uniref:hypothetical protein n=1 Tax=Streptomyces sp. 8N616 TaxID=3457414 RepID=UPI003FD05BEA
MIEARMRGLAQALTLAEPTATLPNIGPRLLMHRESDALLMLDDCEYLMRVPIGGDWARFVCSGGSVVVAVGLAPLPAHAPQDVVESYVVDRVAEGRLLLGKTHVIPST